MAGKNDTANIEKSKELSYEEISKYVIDSLMKLGVIRRTNQTYKNTEILLFKYNDLKESIKDREEEIKEIEKYGLRGKSASITKMSSGSANRDKDLMEQEVIDSLIKEIKKTSIVVNRIDRVVKKFNEDKYGDIIRLKYFEGKTQEEIADYFDKDPTTIWRHNQRIINAMKVYLFPNDVIDEISA